MDPAISSSEISIGEGGGDIIVTEVGVDEEDAELDPDDEPADEGIDNDWFDNFFDDWDIDFNDGGDGGDDADGSDVNIEFEEEDTFDDAMGDEPDDLVDDWDGCDDGDKYGFPRYFWHDIFNSAPRNECIKKRVDFLIVGCGLAGLAAARRIEEVNKKIMEEYGDYGGYGDSYYGNSYYRRRKPYTYMCVESDRAVGGRAVAAEFLSGDRNPLFEFVDSDTDFTEAKFASVRNYDSNGEVSTISRVVESTGATEKSSKVVLLMLIIHASSRCLSCREAS